MTVTQMVQLIRQFVQRSPLVVVSVAVTSAVLLYYGVLGVRYFKAIGQANKLTEQVDELTLQVRRIVPDVAGLETELEQNAERGEELRKQFAYPISEDLLDAITITAEETAVDLRSMSVGDAAPQSVGALEYQVQPITVALQGETQAIVELLSELRKKVPVISVGGVQMSRLDSKAPSAQVELLFYLSPQPISDKARLN